MLIDFLLLCPLLSPSVLNRPFTILLSSVGLFNNDSAFIPSAHTGQTREGEAIETRRRRRIRGQVAGRALETRSLSVGLHSVQSKLV